MVTGGDGSGLDPSPVQTAFGLNEMYFSSTRCAFDARVTGGDGGDGSEIPYFLKFYLCIFT